MPQSYTSPSGRSTTTKVRIGKALLKSLPAPIAAKITALQGRYGTIKSVRMVVEQAPAQLFLDEDCRYWHARHNAEKGAYVVSEGIQMAGEHNLGAAGLRREIGARIPLAVGDFVFEVFYAGSDGYQLRLINIVEGALPTAGTQALLEA